MRLKALFAAITAAILFSSCSASVPEVTKASETEAVSDYTPRSHLLRCLYYDDRDFRIYDEKSKIYDINGKAMCGIAPHHLAAGQLIAGMYRTAAASRDDIDTVVLLAPMHYDCSSTLITSSKGWQTAFGAVENDTEITDMFIDELGAFPDDAMSEYDHSISSHIPFIRRYLPDAKISFLMVSPKERGDIPQKLSKLLTDISRKRNCFFAFSIDFSHYLDPDDADRHDEETRRAVMNADNTSIMHFTNSNVDTPYCLSTFVRLSGLLGADITEAANNNTYNIGVLPYSRTVFPEGVTSYFVFLSAIND